MYREVLFELIEGRAVTPLFLALSHEHRSRARIQSLTISSEVVAVLVDYVGPAQAVGRVRDVVHAGDGERVAFRYDMLLDEEKHVRFVATWTRPPHMSQGVSLEHVLFDTVGPGGLMFGRVEDGVIAYKAASVDGRGLTEFLAAVQLSFGTRFKVRPLRTGPFKPGWEIEDAPRAVNPDEEALLSAALAAGYYDEPKRCGVRELG
ncbi:MAG: hypothetical protein WDA16_06765, partial [Candidatus Thermoplasmatota archaeon]